MKTITKLSALGAIIAAFGATVVFADDSQLQNRLSIQRSQNNETGSTATVALYAGRQGVSRSTSDDRTEVRFEIRTNAHGQSFNAYAPAQ